MMLTDEDKKWLVATFATKRELDEKLEALETKLLTAFHHFAESNSIRHRSTEMTLRSLQIRVDSVEERLDKLEQK